MDGGTTCAPLPLLFRAVFRWQLVPIKHHNGDDTMVKQHPDSGHAELDEPALAIHMDFGEALSGF
jgi:hypothetical protein